MENEKSTEVNPPVQASNEQPLGIQVSGCDVQKDGVCMTPPEEYPLLKDEEPTQHEIEMAGGDVALATEMHGQTMCQVRTLCYSAVTKKFHKIIGSNWNEYLDQCIQKKQGIDPEKINALQKYILDMLAILKKTKQNL